MWLGIIVSRSESVKRKEYKRLCVWMMAMEQNQLQRVYHFVYILQDLDTVIQISFQNSFFSFTLLYYHPKVYRAIDWLMGVLSGSRTLLRIFRKNPGTQNFNLPMFQSEQERPEKSFSNRFFCQVFLFYLESRIILFSDCIVSSSAASNFHIYFYLIPTGV